MVRKKKKIIKYSVRTFDGLICFFDLKHARKFLLKSGKKRYSALYNEKNNKLLKWKSPTGIR